MEYFKANFQTLKLKQPVLPGGKGPVCRLGGLWQTERVFELVRYASVIQAAVCVHFGGHGTFFL